MSYESHLEHGFSADVSQPSDIKTGLTEKSLCVLLNTQLQDENSHLTREVLQF